MMEVREELAYNIVEYCFFIVVLLHCHQYDSSIHDDVVIKAVPEWRARVDIDGAGQRLIERISRYRQRSSKVQ